MAGELTPQEMAQNNARFMLYATERNYTMSQSDYTHPAQSIQHEITNISGYVKYIDFVFDVYLNITGTTAPQLSPFAPWNVIRNVQIMLSGGAFQNVSPIFYWLRERANNYGYSPETSGMNYGYSAQSVFSCPTPIIGENHWRFVVRVPFQQTEGQALGLIPLGDNATKLKVNFEMSNALWSTDQYNSPLFGGSSDVQVKVSTTSASRITPVIYYLTAPASQEPISPPHVGMVLNVQETNTSFISTNTLTPIKYPNPFVYMRLWHLIIDGTGAPTTSAIQSMKLDFSPTLTQFDYPNKEALSSYYQATRRRYGNDLPPGVVVFDLFTGSNPFSPNGTQTIDARLFQSMQSQIAVQSGTNIQTPAKIITFAEALSPVPM